MVLADPDTCVFNEDGHEVSVPSSSIATTARTEIRPRAVNLMALLSRLMTTCLTLPASPDSARPGRLASELEGQLQALVLRELPEHPLHRRASARGRRTARGRSVAAAPLLIFDISRMSLINVRR